LHPSYRPCRSRKSYRVRSSSDRFGSGGPDQSRSDTAHVAKSFRTRFRQQRMQNAERRCSSTAASFDAARGLQSALASRRSTAALVGRLSPPNSTSGHASWDSAGMARSYGPPSGEDRDTSPRALPAPAYPSPGFQHPHRSSCRRADAQSRSSAAVTNRRPRAPHLAPPAGVTG
jgi:hypothetical protein